MPHNPNEVPLELCNKNDVHATKLDDNETLDKYKNSNGHQLQTSKTSIQI